MRMTFEDSAGQANSEKTLMVEVVNMALVRASASKHLRFFMKGVQKSLYLDSAESNTRVNYVLILETSSFFYNHTTQVNRSYLG